jgi:hypothetical protein
LELHEDNQTTLSSCSEKFDNQYQILVDEGTPDRPSIFAYLVFGPGGTSVEAITRPITSIA